MTVASLPSSSDFSSAPSAAFSLLAIMTLAPTVKGKNSSSTEISKDVVVTATSVSSVLRPGSRAILDKKLTTQLCGTMTPLGRPVEPEVYNTYASA